ILVTRTSPGIWRRSFHEPGVTACLASMAGLGLSLLALGGAMAIEWAVYGRLRRGFALWVQAYLLSELVVIGGMSVAAVWLVQAVSGRWRPRRDPYDRLGRLVGAAWIAAGMAWALRHYEDLMR